MVRAGGAAVGALVVPVAFGALARGADDVLPTVVLGATKRVVPRLGIGCFPVGNLEKDEDAAAVLARALEMGVRYFDTAPSYSNGRSEKRVGAALQKWLSEKLPRDAPKRTRDDVYVATKTLERTADGARREVEASLKRLQLEYVDCLQVHEVHDDYEGLFGEGKVIKGLEKARDEGLIKNIGITGHRNPKWIVEAFKKYPFVSALVPINPLEVQHLSFIKELLPVAIEKNVAVIGMKLFAGGHLVSEGKLKAAECVEYALAQKGVAVIVPGCDKVEYVDEDAAAAIEFGKKAPTAQWLAEVEKKAGAYEGKKSEWYKEEK